MENSFSVYLKDNRIRERWLKIKKYFFLRESTYDMTNRCNLQCDGCYYYAGEKSLAVDETNPESWRALFKSEKQRGITFVVLAGAEPSLVPDFCQIAYEEIPLGAIATNGIKCIPAEVKYSIHISVWGNDSYSFKYRKIKDCLKKQLNAYENDDRAVFIYTFTGQNIDQIDKVAENIVKQGQKLSFNQFSAPVNYNGELKLDSPARKKMYDKIMNLLTLYPENILYSKYNAQIHSHEKSLHDLFFCPYPRMNKKNRIVGLGKSFRQYRSDLTIDDSVACCVPDTDCQDCRHYAAGSAIVTARLLKHIDSSEMFCKWLDYVDTYLSVWIYGYKKDSCLIN